MNSDLVSVIMPAHNAERFIGQSIESVQAQTRGNWELLVTDDCSMDHTVEIVERMAAEDPRIRLARMDRQGGAAQARNQALGRAQGRYIAFLDSDDVWRPEKLERQLEFMEQGSVAFSITSYGTMAEDGTLLKGVVRAPRMLNYRRYLRNTAIGCLTVVIDRERTGDFLMPDIRSSHDMALWLLIMRRGFRVHGLRENLATYRLVSNSNTAKKWRAAQDVWRVYRDMEHLSLPYSAFNFCGYAINAVLKRL